MKLRLLPLMLLACPLSVAFANEASTENKANTASAENKQSKEVATKYTCTQGKAQRTVEIAYEGKDKKVPCKVVYTKEGAAKDLWTSQSKVGFCEEKAAAFIEKLKGLGLTCKADSAGGM